MKIPSREDGAKDSEIVSKPNVHRPDIKVAAIDDIVKEVEVLSKYDEISALAKKRKEKDAEIKRKYERLYGKVSATRDNSDVQEKLVTRDPYSGKCSLYTVGAVLLCLMYFITGKHCISYSIVEHTSVSYT